MPSTTHKPFWTLGILFALASILAAQSRAPGPLAGAGYAPPAPLRAAPGQVLTLFLHTPGSQPAAPILATRVPLPTSLGGFSVVLEQTLRGTPVAVPLTAVFPVDNCYGLVPSVCSDLTAITLRVPLELIVNSGRRGRPENFAVLRVSRDGEQGPAIPLEGEPANLHVVTTCDISPAPVIEDRAGCQAVVRHADGRLVTSANPARPGETLTMFAYGLGEGAGDESSDAPVREPVALPGVEMSFEFGPNRPPSPPGTRPGEGPALVPLFAGLIPGPNPGDVGLYRIQFQAPTPPMGTPACIGGGITSNLTVNVARGGSYAGAPLCAAVDE